MYEVAVYSLYQLSVHIVIQLIHESLHVYMYNGLYAAEFMTHKSNKVINVMYQVIPAMFKPGCV